LIGLRVEVCRSFGKVRGGGFNVELQGCKNTWIRTRERRAKVHFLQG